MIHKFLPLIVLITLAVLSVACAAQKVSGASNDPPTVPGNSSGEGAVMNLAALVEDLQAAGAQAEQGDPVEQAFFSVPGQILKVNGADVQVFEYESEETMGTEASQVSADGGTIGTSMVSWVEAPHFFRSGRILVLYVGTDAQTLSLLEGALGEQFAGR